MNEDPDNVPSVSPAARDDETVTSADAGRGGSTGHLSEADQSTVDWSQDAVDVRVSDAGAVQVQKVLGDYQILGEIGRGGMGIVYVARQVSLGRKVALKMIRSGELADQKEVQRFYAEAQAAANLRHPGIVSVYEVGKVGDRHFFSMEYVEGQPLSHVTRDHPLAADRAANYVVQIAEAIHYAHGRNVLHRDLKPSNILIDDGGRPRVTDFGLAKTLGGVGDLTVTGQVVGTPSFMSPEQAQARQREIGPASDIYSLGAVLYTLLTGRAPFQAESTLTTLKQVVEQEPISPRLLNPEVPRDLETICLKCLDKNAAGRYQTAQDLAEDLKRFVSGQPILARPVGAVERVLKWGRRRPGVSALAAALAVACIAAVAVFVWYQLKLQGTNKQLVAALADAESKNRIANQQRARADGNAEQAIEQRDLMLTTIEEMVFEFQDLLRDTPATLRFKRQLLETAIARLNELPRTSDPDLHIPRTLAVAQSRLGDIFLALGDVESAMEQYENAYPLLESLGPVAARREPRKGDLAVICERLGNLHLQFRRDPTTALQFFEKAHAERKRIAAEAPSDLGLQRDLSVAFENLGDVHSFLGNLEMAERYYQQSLDLRSRFAGDEDNLAAQRDLSVAYGKMAELQLRRGRPDEARQLFQKAQAIDERRVQLAPSPESQRDLTVTYINLGRLSLARNDTTGALDYLQKATDIRRAIAEEDKGNQLAARDVTVALDSLGNANLQVGKLNEARACFQESAELRETLLQEDTTNRELSRDLTVAYEALGRTEVARGNLAGAADWLTKTVKLREDLVEIDPQNRQSQRDLSVALNLLGNVMLGLDDANSALARFQRSLEICQSIATAESPQSIVEVSQNWIGIGSCHEALEDYEQACNAYVRSLELLDNLGEAARDQRQFLAERIEFCKQKLNVDIK